jgi:hypothetical protein
MTLAVEKTIGQRIHTFRSGNENEKCSGSNHLDQLKGFFRFIHLFATTFISNII